MLVELGMEGRILSFHWKRALMWHYGGTFSLFARACFKSNTNLGQSKNYAYYYKISEVEVVGKQEQMTAKDALLLWAQKVTQGYVYKSLLKKEMHFA